MSDLPSFTWRDAGLHSRLLRALNVGGAGLERLGLTRPAIEPEALLDAAARQTRLSDFGPDTLREPLAVLCESVEREARLHTFGRIALRGLIVTALAKRLELIEWAKRHPEVLAERIERPWVVLGLPRTGTTLLSFLMGLDPLARPLVQWEASHPVPPPTLADMAEDPRIAATAKQFRQLEDLNPPIRAMHPFGATLATECVTLLIFDLRSLSIETQALLPGYGRWLEKADHGSAYALHRLALQVLQSRVPTGAWALKTPQHLWCLDALLATYPDARLVWTHRDPRKVVTSVASLNTALHRMNSDHVDPVAVGQAWRDKLHFAVERGLEHDRAQPGSDWCAHLQYAELMADPVEAVRGLYAHFGEELHPLHERRMRQWMTDRPQQHHGRHAYDPADFALSNDAIAERFAPYTTRFAIPPEPA